MAHTYLPASSYWTEQLEELGWQTSATVITCSSCLPGRHYLPNTRFNISSSFMEAWRSFGGGPIDKGVALST
ncbi:hypothetical protein M413DRAFT_447563 [Hebeloma cylindrosporum]|uniref:Uncharacterized protein n=1 Tax=Hebeloma cylindrosporum TaxID=76867 RepID=A0A0C3C3L6_HEBCY|nr:hypothetical protein M413DRAFT_447563 [Hebeloma cylindrosporum h7]